MLPRLKFSPGYLSFIFTSLLILVTFSLSAQDTAAVIKARDTTNIKEHSPRKATIYSMVLPGLGQAYNHKYWKVPVVYAGFAATTYFIITNNQNYRRFKDAYAYSTSSDKTNPPPNDLVIRYSSDQLLTGREYYRRNLEVSYIVTGVWYILNIVDATVDAHFFNYNVNEDLSMQVKPWIAPPMAGLNGSGGLSLRFNF